jgi:hypothetical protein
MYRHNKNHNHKSNQISSNLRIDNLRLEAQNIHLVLSQLSEKTSIPIGLEVSLKDDLSVRKQFQIQIDHGTLVDVLEAIVKQDPVYTWTIREGVVNILPQECCRDPFLQELLSVGLEKFSIKRGLGKLGFRLKLSADPAVKTLLDRYRVVEDNQSFMSRDLTPLGRNYELEVRDVSVVELLNRVVRESQTKYWIMQRYGEHRQFFVVNL